MGQICKAILGSPTRTQDKACTKTIVAYDKANPGNECASKPNVPEKAACYKNKVINPPPPAPTHSDTEVRIEVGASLNMVNPDIADSSGGGAAIKQGSLGSRYKADDDFGGLSFPITAAYGKKFSDAYPDLKVRFGIQGRYSELNPYFDKYQDPMTPHLSRFAAMGLLGIQKEPTPSTFIGVDLLFGGIKTWSSDNKDESRSFKTSDLASATSVDTNKTIGTALDKWALIGGLSLRAGATLVGNIYGAVTLDALWDSLSSDNIKNPESTQNYSIETKGPTITGTAAIGVKF